MIKGYHSYMGREDGRTSCTHVIKSPCVYGSQLVGWRSDYPLPGSLRIYLWYLLYQSHNQKTPKEPKILHPTRCPEESTAAESPCERWPCRQLGWEKGLKAHSPAREAAGCGVWGRTRSAGRVGRPPRQGSSHRPAGGLH